MPSKKIDLYEVGGVDSRSNVLNFPAERAFRMRNFRPLQSGRVILRFGYSKPQQSNVSNTSIHSLAYYEIYAGGQFALLGQGANLNVQNLATGVRTNISSTMGGNRWGHFRAYNRIFVGDGTQFVSYDGTTLRPVGIRAPSAGEASAVTVTPGATTGGAWATTALSGYTLFMVYYNPVTGAVGNRVQIGSAFTIGVAGDAVVLGSLPNLAAVNAEWVKGFGRTNDGGQVPYWLVDANGNRITAANAAAGANILLSTIDVTQQLPIRNGLPPAGLNAFTRVGNRVFGIKPGDNNIYFSEDATTYTANQFIGVDVESWAGNGSIAFPTGEVPTCIQTYRLEGWFFSQNYLAIWNPTLAQQAANPWRGPWQSGAPGQRCFVETPYGPVWLTTQKQLMTFNQGYTTLETAGYFGPTPLSSEYERVLLGQIGDQYISIAELGYFRDPEHEIDCVYVIADNSAGQPIVIVHDFILRDERSQQGQGRDAIYSGMNPTTFAGAGCTPRQNIMDTNHRERLWVGASNGNLFQLEDGSNSDGGANYTGDWINLINSGNNKPIMEEVQWQGDGNTTFTFSVNPSLGLADWSTPETEAVTPEDGNSIFAARVGQEARWVFGRFQLTSHPADGVLTVTGEEIPVATYGRISMVTARVGVDRPESRS